MAMTPHDFASGGSGVGGGGFGGSSGLPYMPMLGDIYQIEDR